VIPDDLLPACKFQLDSDVTLPTTVSRPGKVIGRAQYINADPCYLVRHENGAGDLVEQWYSEDALTAARLTTPKIVEK
jgi:hypothetical protein